MRLLYRKPCKCEKFTKPTMILSDIVMSFSSFEATFKKFVNSFEMDLESIEKLIDGLKSWSSTEYQLQRLSESLHKDYVLGNFVDVDSKQSFVERLRTFVDLQEGKDEVKELIDETFEKLNRVRLRKLANCIGEKK